MFGTINDKRSSSNVLKNISSSSIHIDQDQVEQSSVQKENVKSTNLGKSDGPVKNRMVRFSKPEHLVLIEQKLP
jgi:hypothetical protein